MKLGVYLKTAVVTSIVLFAFLLVSQTQRITDWWRLRNYVPPQAIAELATNSGMNDEGRRLFYIYHPELLGKEQIQEKCTIGVETIVIGCYITDTSIFVFDVEDERLEGIEEVTAAHEMLHAAYDRLGKDEQDRINQLLDAVYKELDDESLRARIQSYIDRDPSVLYDELHSTLGTELRVLPQSLEDHYARYFEDRLKSVTLAEQYAEEFSKRQTQIEAYDQELQELQGDITRIQADLSSESQAINSERIAVLSLQTADPELYASAVQSFNNRVALYNAQAISLRDIIAQFNDTVALRNAIALEERQLVEAIDTRTEEIIR